MSSPRRKWNEAPADPNCEASARFQDLVSEARTRIARACPEWTEHNVSDPGITLIELFAWMTEMTIYRLNRVPDKLHVALLELLGIRLDGPSAAQTSLRFRLSEPPREPLLIPGGTTEVGTPRTANEESVIFQVDEDFTIPPTRPAAYVLSAAARSRTSAWPTARRARRARPARVRLAAAGRRRAATSASRSRWTACSMQIEVDASQARGAGVNPEDPPLRWEVSQADGEWADAIVLEDLTGGFNYGSGTVELELPPRSVVQPLAATACTGCAAGSPRRPRSGRTGATYSHPPEIYSITAAPMGARLPPRTPRAIEREIIGVSDGTPGQSPPLRNQPVLKPHTGETLEVQDPESGDWATWELREDFVGSSALDRHFALDLVSGSVELGPAIRETDGGWTQYGAVPPKGAVLRFTGYRHGGGRQGNVTAGTLTVLKSAIPGVDTVTNPDPATGGVDAEIIRHAASARRWRSARAIARSPPRTSSSWPARRARASRARSASRRRRRRCRCTSSRASTRPTGGSRSTS
jgi:predicted phage baseplate assembly protein